MPITPAIAEPSTGESMGQSADKMAKLNGITREAQDRFALRSHLNAAAGTADGRLTAEIAPVPVPPAYATMLASDNGIRSDTSYEQLAALKPVFDRQLWHGDGRQRVAAHRRCLGGAADVGGDARRALGYTPLAFIRSYAYAAVDPGEQLLQAPVLAAPMALKRAGLTLRDMDLVDMHEAFAAQVLSNIQGLALEGVGGARRIQRGHGRDR